MSAYRCEIKRGHVSRAIEVEANNEPHARQLAEALCEPGEEVPRGFSAVMLKSRAAIDPTPSMGPDHARNVALSSQRVFADYHDAHAEARRRARRLGRDVGIESAKEYGQRVYRLHLLPDARNRQGFELRCEVVTPSAI